MELFSVMFVSIKVGLNLQKGLLKIPNGFLKKGNHKVFRIMSQKESYRVPLSYLYTVKKS